MVLPKRAVLFKSWLHIGSTNYSSAYAAYQGTANATLSDTQHRPWWTSCRPRHATSASPPPRYRLRPEDSRFFSVAFSNRRTDRYQGVVYYTNLHMCSYSMVLHFLGMENWVSRLLVGWKATDYDDLPARKNETTTKTMVLLGNWRQRARTQFFEHYGQIIRGFILGAKRQPRFHPTPCRQD